MARSTDDDTPVRSVSFRPFITAVFCIVIILAINWIVALWRLDDWQARSGFGDMFGIANSLFAGLAFAGVIYAILLQREELSLQRQELVATRGELKRAAKAQEDLVKEQQASDRLLARQTELLESQARALENTAHLDSLRSMPAISCGVSWQSDELRLTLSNGGGLAFDLDLVAISRHTFGFGHFQNRFADQGASVAEDNSFGLINRYRHAVFATDEQVLVYVARPKVPHNGAQTNFFPASVHVLLQYRDVTGTNYYQVQIFSQPYGAYVIHEAVPYVPAQHPRFDLSVSLDEAPQLRLAGGFFRLLESSFRDREFAAR